MDNTLATLVMFGKMAVVTLPLVTSWLSMSLSFDKLVWLEFNRYPAEWERDGRPTGIWSDPLHAGEFVFFRRMPNDRLAHKWFVSTPVWATQDAEAIALLKRYRLGIVFFFVALPLMFLMSPMLYQ